MFRQKYHIQMQTPLGSRSGTLEAEIEKQEIRGYLHVLKHAQPFEGSIDENGHCSIRGTLITLMSSIPYTATGQITSDSLQLSLQGGRYLFPITGSSCERMTESVKAAKERECL